MEAIVAIFILVGTMLSDLIDAPPRDLASFLDPSVVLEAAQLGTDEASLITLIDVKPDNGRTYTDEDLKNAVANLGADDGRTRQEARKVLKGARERSFPFLQGVLNVNDPEVRVTAKELIEFIKARRLALEAAERSRYLNELMAIRLLQKKKSKKALPALKKIAAGTDVTLSDAAGHAVAVIEGKDVAKADMTQTLKALQGAVPDRMGFTLVCDVGSKTSNRTIRDYLKDGLKLLRADNNEAMNQIIMMAENQVPKITREFEQGIVEAINKMWNIRIDAFTAMVSEDLDEDNGYFAMVFKGLYDPDRLMLYLKSEVGRLEEIKYKGMTISHEDEVAFCAVDKNTFVFVIAEEHAAIKIRPILKQLTSEKVEEPAKTAKPAFDMVLNKKRRIAVSGTLGDIQREILKDELKKELKRMQQRLLRRAQQDGELPTFIKSLEMWLHMMESELAVLSIDKNTALDGRLKFEDEKQAKAMAASLIDLDKTMRDMIQKQVLRQVQNNGQAALMIVGFSKFLEKPMWSAKQQGNTVIITTPSIMSVFGDGASLMLMLML